MAAGGHGSTRAGAQAACCGRPEPGCAWSCAADVARDAQPPSGRQEWGQRAAEVRRYHLAMNEAGVHINDKPGLEDADVLPEASHRHSPVMRDES